MPTTARATPRRPRARWDLAARHALRRVAGLSTELKDITEVEYRQLRLERVVLVGVWTEGTSRTPRTPWPSWPLLAETAGSTVLDALYQRRAQARPGDLHRPRQGRGRARDRPRHRRRHGDLRRRARAQPAEQPRGQGQGQGRRPHRADPGHLRPAREEQGGQGAGRAGPAELHEAAAPRLGGNLSRQAGGRVAGGAGIGGRGPGETKIETDRRRINTKIAKLRRELAHMRPPARPSGPAVAATRSRASRSPATPTPASPACSTG